MHDQRRAALSKAPRPVKLPALAVTVFGGVWRQLGFLCLAIGLALFALLGAQSEFVTRVTFVGVRATVPGEVVAVKPTRSGQDGAHIMAVHYAYEVDGTAYRGVSYRGAPALLEPGAAVRVVHLKRAPERSHIEGLRMKLFASDERITLFLLAFPFIGLLVAAWEARGTLRQVRLLRRGHLAYGRCVGRKETGTETDGHPVYAFTFRFTVDELTDRPGFRDAAVRRVDYEVTTETHAGRFAGDDDHPVLYDPGRPQRALVVDGLPKPLTGTSDGGLSAPTGAAVRAAVAPAACVVLAIACVWTAWL